MLFKCSTLYTSQVSTNGLISFNDSYTQGRTTKIPAENDVIIAPYWTDLDITDGGNVFFKETTQPELLDYISTEVKSVAPSFTHFEAHWALIVTWVNVKSKRFIEVCVIE